MTSMSINSRHLSLAFAFALAAMLMPVITLACGPVDLEIGKSGPATINPGESITYKVRVGLEGNHPGSAAYVVVTDKIPKGLTFKPEATRFEHAGTPTRIPSCSQEGNSVVCNLGSMSEDRTKHSSKVDIYLTFATAPSLACTTIVNTATVSAREDEARHEKELDRSNNTNAHNTKVTCPATPTPTPVASPTPTPSTTPTPTPNVEKGIDVEKTDNKDVTRPGHSLTYVITVKNTGNIDLHDVVVTDTVPGQLTVTSIANGGSLSGSTITWNGALGANETMELRYTATVKSNTANNHSLLNKVTAESNDHDLEDTATDTTLVQVPAQVKGVSTPVKVVAVPVTAKTGAGLIASVSTILGAAGLAFASRRGF